jgi:hypothetical protein
MVSELSIQKSLNEYLEGQSLSFIHQLIENLTESGLFGEYIGVLIVEDCEALKRLYDHCLNRNHQLKEKTEFNRPAYPATKAG